MTKEDAYVENAVESLELAERLASSSDRCVACSSLPRRGWNLPMELTTADVTPPPHMHDHALAKAELGSCHLDR